MLIVCKKWEDVMGNLDPRAADVLTFWFDETPPKQRFVSNEEFDQLIRDRFGESHSAAAKGGLDHWMETAPGAMALVILLDQFSRNIFRGHAEAFAQDEKARAVADAAIETGHDMATADDRRAFFYLPHMHAEDLAIQERCIALIKERLGEDSGNMPHAIWHRDVIAEFGRFPFRNKALGRETTAEEEAYLKARETSG